MLPQLQVPTSIAVIATFAAADGFGAPVKLAVSATYTTTSSVVIGDRLQMTCNVTNTALKIREVKWFHIRERFGKERLTLTPQLIHRASNGDTTASLEFSVSRGMEGQYYCLVNSAFRSNTVKILVQKVPVFMKHPDNCTVYSGYSVNTKIVIIIQSQITPDVACLSPRRNVCLCSTNGARNVSYHSNLHAVSCGVPVTTARDEGWYSVVITSAVTTKSVSSKFYVTVIAHPSPPSIIEVITTSHSAVVKWQQPPQTNVSGVVDLAQRLILFFEKKGSQIAHHLVIPLTPNSYYLDHLDPCADYSIYMQSQGVKLVSNISSKVAMRTKSLSSHRNRFLIDVSTNEVIIKFNGVIAPVCLRRQLTDVELSAFCKNALHFLEVDTGNREYKNFHEIHSHCASRKQRSGSLSPNACPATLASCHQNRRLKYQKMCAADLEAEASLAKNEISSGLCQSARAYKIIEAVIISVLFIATIIISFCCGRQFRGERAITPDTFEEMEGLKQVTRTNQGAMGELLTLAGQNEERMERVSRMLQSFMSQTKGMSGNGNLSMSVPSSKL